MNNDSESDWSLFSDWQRVASLLVAFAYLLVAPILFPAKTWSHFMADIIIWMVALAFPLACIWFSDDLAESYLDRAFFYRVTPSNQGRFLRWTGWLLLLLPVLIFLLVQLLSYLYIR